MSYHSLITYPMKADRFEIEPQTPFSKSLIWQLNRDFYRDRGISAWSEDIVPHQLTSNAKVGETYAELIYAFLKDLAAKGKTEEVVYILELGAGHGRLAFHILKHLQKLIDASPEPLPPFCYVLSDIVEENLSFFQHHPQFQEYFQAGILEFAYFDASRSKELHLRLTDTIISPQDLQQPILTIANYFFDSIPNELFFIQDEVISTCSVSIHSKEDPAGMSPEGLIHHMELSYHQSRPRFPIYQEALLNEILEEYRKIISHSYVFFPRKAITCLKNLKAFSTSGLVLLSMDKGFHELHNLQNKKVPDIVTHGSFSLWVNYHALGAYCTKQGGKALFPSFSNFHLEIGCLLFLEESETYPHIDTAYQQFIDQFGPDDFSSIKKLAYFNVNRLKLKELIALFRLGAYDSTLFINLLPRLKEVSQTITLNERTRLAQTLDRVWDMYFNIHEDFDLAYEIGGMLYDLGYYREALAYFQHSVDLFGQKADSYYNQALCYYQLRQDKLFYQTVEEAKKAFPNFDQLMHLEQLDMS